MNENTMDMIFAFAGSVCGWFFGGLDGVIKLLIALSLIDYCTGVMAAYERKDLSSKEGLKGIVKKLTIFLLVGTANVIDNEMLGGTELLRDAVCFFYLGNEGLSILENACDIGLPVPEWLKEKIRGFTEKNNINAG